MCGVLTFTADATPSDAENITETTTSQQTPQLLLPGAKKKSIQLVNSDRDLFHCYRFQLKSLPNIQDKISPEAAQWLWHVGGVLGFAGFSN